MLELDLLLQGFIEKDGLESLDEAEKRQFEKLLAYPDNLLLEYLMDNRSPADALSINVIEKIRHAASA